ncbi:hypothetical protein Ami103574_02020 [Aminipila butyrica]|uniref:Uncharacterized protein n=1 Tax=Aminipila butyrica TaxID=433296 RepID=A0A858BSG8_9FIRM|nr:hypothetical protein [Aminipila butyrica]QIB68159.1 hypothetical protein Ami103574_02020 [Aminipila butyrica]
MGVSVIGGTSPEVWKMLGIDFDESGEEDKSDKSGGKQANKDKKRASNNQEEKTVERMRRD